MSVEEVVVLRNEGEGYLLKMHLYKDCKKGLKLHAGPLKYSPATTRQLQRIMGSGDTLVGSGEKLVGPDWLEAAAFQ